MTLFANVLYFNNLGQTFGKIAFFLTPPLLLAGIMIIGISGKSSLHSLRTDVIFGYVFQLLGQIFKIQNVCK